MTPTSPRLTPLALEVFNLNPDGYRKLTASGDGHAAAYGPLTASDPSRLVSGEIRDLDMAKAVSCALWLWHDWLDEAHRIAQGIDSETGAFWHAIMHRREGDFSNSKYWLARCRWHPVRQAIGNQAAVVLAEMPADTRLLRLTLEGWNAEYFVDLVQQHHAGGDEQFIAILTTLQQLEWRVLTEYCASLA